MSGFKAKVKKYFSGKLVLVQLTAGVGAFVGRSLAAFSMSDQDTWIIVIASQAGSFIGYIGMYFFGYWFAFKLDYRSMNRSMPKDVVKLQLVEQSPNLGTVISSALTQAALIEGTDVGSDGFESVFSANIASWFGIHKIANFAAMAGSNSLKKGWVDHTWSPGAAMRKLAGKVASPFRKIRLVLKGKEVTNHPHMGTDIPRPKALP